MDTGSYTYEALSKKYDGFAAPGFKIKLAGTEIEQTQLMITNLEVELTASGAAGGCTFTMEGMYDLGKKKWMNDTVDSLEVGAKLSVFGGYVKKEELFFGYVDEYSLEFPEGSAPRVTVNGLDALGYLMCFQEPIHAGKEKPKKIVETILGKAKSAGYASKVTMGPLDGFETPLVKQGVNDWKFLTALAQRYGATLMVVDGELIFKKLTSSTSPLITLTMGGGLYSFERKLSLAHQVGKVEVWGRDVNQKFIKGQADSCSISGSGDTATDLAPAFKKAVLREYSEYAQTQDEADQMAQAKLDSIAMNLVSGRGTCVGLPELIPGRYVKIDGADKKTNGTYYINRVKHIFSQDGYVTEFEIKGARA